MHIKTSCVLHMLLAVTNRKTASTLAGDAQTHTRVKESTCYSPTTL